MGFKVTVHKNGKHVGQSHYTSEAVAVGMAKKMNAASGVQATVERCNGACGMKTNPRRRRNGASLDTTLEWDRMASYGRGNRNWETIAGSGKGTVYYYLSHDPGQPFELSAAKGDDFYFFRDVPYPTLAAAKKAAAEHAVGLGLLAKANPRRRNGVDPVAAMDALVEGDAVEITVKPRYADAKTIKGTVIQRNADYLMVSGARGGKSHFHRTTYKEYKDTRWYMDANGSPTVVGVVKANPRHRRNGTTAANIAASHSLARSRNSGTIDAYVPAYLGLPRHGGSVILAHHPSDKMPTVVGIGTAPTAFQRAQYAGCKFSVVPSSSVKAHRIGG